MSCMPSLPISPYLYQPCLHYRMDSNQICLKCEHQHQSPPPPPCNPHVDVDWNLVHIDDLNPRLEL